MEWRFEMNAIFLGTAAVMGLTTGFHVFAGGPVIMRPIRHSELSKPVKAVADVLWHGITVVLAVMAVGLGWLAYQPNAALLWMICAVQFGFAALFIWYGLRHLGNLKQLPQWIVFLMVPMLSVWGFYG
ncbi:MAG: hypothetical protein ACJAVM_002000 [Sulfitobacter sp.]|jgi:hypothetical protein